MGVSLSINSYKKERSCIVGHISFLGFYEVKLNLIEDHRIPSSYLSHYGEIYLITEILNQDITSFGLENNDLFFYQLASNNWSGQSLGSYGEETTGLMFDPKTLIEPINRLIEAQDYIISYIGKEKPGFIAKEIIENKEIDFLISFKNLVKRTIKEDGMIQVLFS